MSAENSPSSPLLNVNMTRRGCITWLAGFLGGVGSGLTLGRVWDEYRKPDYEPLTLIAVGFRVERYGKENFRLIDTRDTGVKLPPDRMPYLTEQARLLQTNYGCDIREVKEGEGHTLVIETSVECMRAARDAMQVNGQLNDMP